MSDGAETLSREQYAQRRQLRAAERRSSRRRSVPLIAAGALVVLLVAAGVFEAVATSGRVHPGVSVAGIDIGGLRPGSAKTVLETELPAVVERPVVVMHGDKEWAVTAEDVGLGFDFDATVERAMSVGREEGLGFVTSRLGAWFSGVDVPASPTADRVRMDEVLARIAKSTDVAPVDASVDITGASASAVPGEDGRALDRRSLETRILVAMLASDRDVEAPVGVAPMAVTLEEAERAAQVANGMLDRPATVTHGDGTWKLEPSVIARLLVFTRSDELVESVQTTDVASGALGADPSREVTLVVQVSPSATAKHVVPLVGATVGRPAVNARFKTSGGRVTIIPSKDGVGPDVETLAADLEAALLSAEGERVVELKTTKAEPEITTEKARGMGITDRIGRYTTTYSASNKPRVNNIHLLGSALDGKLIAPGKTFSFNGAIGERTAAKGYQEAGAIVNGKLVPQLGGGICQVGTTLFNAVYESGLPVVERRNHSFYIDHYPTGRDATVSWGGPDFKFKNDTDDWVLISVSYTNTSITIALYGTDPNYDVETSVGKWRNVTPFKTEEIKDPTMRAGSRVVEDAGVTGRSITVKRTVYRDGEVIRTDDFVSRYRPKTQVVRVGTKPKAGREATATPRP